jgi:di/tricarboxylate transporter
VTDWPFAALLSVRPLSPVRCVCVQISTFVSHTVCALILMPLIVSLGSHLGHTRTLAAVCTLMMSGTMSLPMSSFPNINSLLIEDDNGTPYLHSIDFIKHGTPMALIALILICTLGFVLVEAVFGANAPTAIDAAAAAVGPLIGIGP